MKKETEQKIADLVSVFEAHKLITCEIPELFPYNENREGWITEQKTQCEVLTDLSLSGERVTTEQAFEIALNSENPPKCKSLDENFGFHGRVISVTKLWNNALDKLSVDDSLPVEKALDKAMWDMICTHV